ncbi:MAG: FAD-dependent oxidoreductase [Gemmiger sp.]
MKIIVIGSIAAGVSAAARLAAGERSAQITVYEKGAFYSCGVGGLPHYLGESLAALNEAIQGKERELAAAGITAHLRHEVQRIDAAARQITVCDLATGRVFTDRYDKLVVATGSSNRIPQVPGANRVGVQTLKSVEDLIFLKEYTRTPYVRDIVILGGSWSGLELAKVFLKMGRKVRIIEKESQLLPQFDPEVSKLIQAELEAQGVQFSLGEQVRAFPGKTFIEQVQTTRGSYPCDLCLVAIGVQPNTALLAGTGAALAPDGAVLIDSDLSTSVPGIYAVGDCAQCRQGSLRTSSLRVGELEIARTGLTEAEARKTGLRVKSAMATGTDRPGICPHPNKITIKLVYEANTRQVVGAQAWGGKNVSARVNAIAVAIRAGMTVDALGQVDFVYSSAQCSIWDPIQIVCGQAT